MLDQHTIEIIKSTVPVLQVHGKTITTAFYGMLFENHPELLNIFNHANQRQGKQQTALANAVLAAAANIDQLENILPVVKQIAEKHRALGVLPEHYPIVGETLLAAIKQVLGDAATPEIMDAWAKAYGVIADAFIGVEVAKYRETAEAPGGWSGFRNFVVSQKVKETDLLLPSTFLLRIKVLFHHICLDSILPYVLNLKVRNTHTFAITVYQPRLDNLITASPLNVKMQRLINQQVSYLIIYTRPFMSVL